MAISLRRLRYFQTIVAAGSLSAASRQLNIAQPALSHHVHELELEFGVELLARSNRGVTVTASGQTLSRYASDILRRVDEADSALRSQVIEPHGNVTIALAVTMARHLVPVLLRIVDQRHPRVSVKIIDASSVPALEAIKSEVVELALVPNAADIPNVDANAIYREPLCLIETTKRGKRNRRSISLSKTAAKPLVLASQNYDLRRRAEEAAIENGCSLNVRYEQDSSEIIRSIVLAGLAATITQSALFHPKYERPLLDIRKIVQPEIVRVHSIVKRRDRSPSLAVAAVESALAVAISDLVSDGTLPGELIK